MANSFPFFIKIQGIDKVSGTFKNVQAGISKMSKSFTNLGAQMTLGLSAPLVAFGALSLKAAADAEGIKTSLLTVTGSLEETEKVYRKLFNFAAKTPFQFPEVSELALTLTVLQKTGAIMESDFDAILSSIGNIAAGTNKPLLEVARHMTKVMFKGKAQADEMIDMSRQGIPIVSYMAKKLNITTTELLKLGTTGKITSKVFIEMIKQMSSDNFSGALDRQSQTLAGLFSTLKDNFWGLKVQIGESIADTFKLKSVMISLSKTLGDLAVNWDSLNPIVKTGVIIFGSILAIAGPVIFGLGQIGFAIVGITSAITLLTPAIAELNLAAMGPALVPILVAVAAIGGAIIFFKDLLNLLGKIWGYLQKFKIIRDIFGDFRSDFDKIPQLSGFKGIKPLSNNFNVSPVAASSFSANAGPESRNVVLVDFKNIPRGVSVTQGPTNTKDFSMNMGYSMMGFN